MIELTEEEFKVIHDALWLVNDPSADEEENVEEIIIAERRAWNVIKAVADRYNAGLS
jgi:hypothetical protein